MTDFNPNESHEEIKTIIEGKTISDFTINRDGMNDEMTFHFNDGTSIAFEFDYIYEFTCKKND